MGTNLRGIGYVGLGNMGLPMAQRIAKEYQLVIYTRRQEQGQQLCNSGQLPGAETVNTINELLHACEVVFFCLPDDAASKQVILEEALPYAQEPCVLVDMSTVKQSTSLRCAQACQAREIDFLDAPISGGPQKAREGKLTIMCGGMQKVYDKVEPIMKTMGSHVRLMGGHGAGTATKLVNQLLVGVHSMAACEAMLLAEKMGIKDQQTLQEVLASSFGFSEVLKRHMPIISSWQQGLRKPCTRPDFTHQNSVGLPHGAAVAYMASAFTKFEDSMMPLRNMVKDLDIVQAAGRDVDISLPVTTAAQRLHADAAREGYGDWDMAVPYVLLGRSEKDMLGPRLGISDEQWGF